MIYDMCVEDIDSDGRADMMYFTDTDEVFFYDRRKLELAAALRPVHPCAQPMEASLLQVGSEMLYVDDLTPTSTKMNIRRRLFGEQIRYIGQVNACNRELELTRGSDEDFGEFEIEDDFMSDDFSADTES